MIFSELIDGYSATIQGTYVIYLLDTQAVNAVVWKEQWAVTHEVLLLIIKGFQTNRAFLSIYVDRYCNTG